MLCRGRVIEQSVDGARNVTRGSYAVLASSGTAPPASFQPCKGGDMACIRGPLVARSVVTYSPQLEENAQRGVNPISTTRTTNDVQKAAASATYITWR